MHKILFSTVKKIRKFLGLNFKKVLKWLAMGLLFMGITTFILMFFVEKLKFSVQVSTFLTAEIVTIIRFYLNSYWVFKVKGPTLRNLFQYHVANISGLIIWIASTNLLAFLGVNYIVAGIFSVFLSTTFSFYSNFFWVWKDHLHK
jgi:putative flippase GtrA